MSMVGNALTSWEDFLQLPDGEHGHRYELHDGEVVLVPPPRPIHVFIQSLLVQWLTDAARCRGRAAQEFPYRPATNLQFWRADVAYVPMDHWQEMLTAEYPVYAPPLIVEVLSPANKQAEINRQRVAAFSGGTREFWVIDADAWTVETSLPGVPTRVYGPQDSVTVSVLPDAVFPVRALFETRNSV